MNCPVCRVDMIVVEYEGVELDHCVKCSGVWFDRNELEYFLERSQLRIEDLHIKAATAVGADFKSAPGAKEKLRRCPLCRKPMAKLAVGGADPLLIDRCERHGGYWFDGGELPRAARGNFQESEWKRVASFLGELFPEKQ
ncbi:MAG: zf-TFIIB domain-containing protein [bacterium]